MMFAKLVTFSLVIVSGMGGSITREGIPFYKIKCIKSKLSILMQMIAMLAFKEQPICLKKCKDLKLKRT